MHRTDTSVLAIHWVIADNGRTDESIKMAAWDGQSGIRDERVWEQA